LRPQWDFEAAVGCHVIGALVICKLRGKDKLQGIMYLIRGYDAELMITVERKRKKKCGSRI
jgi:hypothetical protein